MTTRELTIKALKNDCYEVVSKKENKTDVYIVDMKHHYCHCKGFGRWKKCVHMDNVKAQLKDKGRCINW